MTVASDTNSSVLNRLSSTGSVNIPVVFPEISKEIESEVPEKFEAVMGFLPTLWSFL